jgi:di/tricarboxylate transporter
MFLGFGLDAWITIVTLVLVIFALVRTRLRADLVFLSAVGVLFVTGVLNAGEAFAGFTSTPVLVIGVMCVVVAGLSSTGVIQRISKYVLGKPKGEFQTFVRLMLPVAVLSSFIVNSTVVMIFTGVVKMWARKFKLKASRLFIPMSYAAVMGGALLIFVTPSGLVISGLYTAETGQTLNIFEPFLPALACLAAGMVVIFALRRLLPDRTSSEAAFEKTDDYTIEMMVTSNNPHIAKTVGELGLNNVAAGSLVELIHFDNERMVSPVNDDEPLMGGDRLIFSGKINELLEMAMAMKFTSPDRPVFSVQSPKFNGHHATAYVCFGSSLIGTRLGESSFEKDHQMTLVAVSRRGERINQPPREVILQAGDSLFFVKPLHKKFDTEALKADLHFFDMPDIPVKGWEPVISSAILMGMIILAVTGVMPLLKSVFIAAGAMIVFDCCSPSQAMNAINWRLLLSIGGGITLGTALQTTGVAHQVAMGILGICGDHPLMVMIAFCLMGAIITEFISNTAAAALLFPILCSAIDDIHCDLLPFAMVLLLAVNSAFMTPFSTPLNMMVYGPGGYNAKDFLCIGLPVKLAYLATAILTIYLIYPIA